MMKTMLKPAFLMEEIAVELHMIYNLMYKQIIAQYVNALKEEGEMEELHLVEAAIRVGFLMGIVMISTII